MAPMVSSSKEMFQLGAGLGGAEVVGPVLQEEKTAPRQNEVMTVKRTLVVMRSSVGGWRRFERPFCKGSGPSADRQGLG